MNYINYKHSYAWQTAIDLIPLVNRLSDDLPAGEGDSLGGELRRTVIDLATGIAVTIMSGSAPKLESAIRLETQLEVIRRVYPALDTSAVEQSLSSLLQRLQSDDYAEMKPLPPPPSPALQEPLAADIDGSTDETAAPVEAAAPDSQSPPPTLVEVRPDAPTN